MMLFLSTYLHKIDKKGRVSVPATFRTALSQDSFQGFVAFRSYKHAAIECCSASRMMRLSESMDGMDLFSDTQDDLAASVFADAQQLAFDGDGRVVVPKLLLDHMEIEDTVAFVGRGSTFQLWKPETFEALQQEARARIKENQPLLKLQPKGEGA